MQQAKRLILMGSHVSEKPRDFCLQGSFGALSRGEVRLFDEVIKFSWPAPSGASHPSPLSFLSLPPNPYNSYFKDTQSTFLSHCFCLGFVTYRYHLNLAWKWKNVFSSYVWLFQCLRQGSISNSMKSHLLGDLMSLLKLHNMLMYSGLESGFLPAVLRNLGDSLLRRKTKTVVYL